MPKPQISDLDNDDRGACNGYMRMERSRAMQPQATVDGATTAEKYAQAMAEVRDEYLATHSYPWIIGFSGGKDSTLVLQVVVEVLLSLPPSQRKRPVHVLTNDTLVESPIVSRFVDGVCDRIRDAVEGLDLPVVVAKTTPAADQTFWVNLIGRGYPSPNRMFRWCTDRMKIAPTSNYIRSQVAANGEVILLIGVRRAESATRAASVNRYTTEHRLNPHNTLNGCLVFRPIVDLSTDEVWQILLQRRPPWGGSHRDLVTLYRNADGGECPLVLDKSDAPSCGTSSSRFGCWTCTVVEKDKSAQGFIDAGFDEIEPLMDFRDWLAEIRNDKSKRMAHRRNGLVTFTRNDEPVPGPFTLAARAEILRRLLGLQRDVSVTLITDQEVEIIRRIWAEDATDIARRAINASVA